MEALVADKPKTDQTYETTGNEGLRRYTLELKKSLWPLPESIGQGINDLFQARLTQLSSSILEYERTVQSRSWTDHRNCEVDARFKSLLTSDDFIDYLERKYPIWLQLIHSLQSNLASFAFDLAHHARMHNFTVLEVTPLNSDPHCHGRSALKVTTNRGVWVYKPRSTYVDFYFQCYLQLLNQLHGEEFFVTTQVLPDADHGWIQFHQTVALDESLPPNLYFKRVGGLLSVIYALAGVDFHHENHLSTARGPVLIDLEGLLQPQVATIEYEHSVLTTGFLPSALWDSKNAKFDHSAVGRLMRSSPLSQANSMIEGFREIYKLQQAHNKEILSSKAFNGLGQSPVRMLFANTHNYVEVLRSLMTPKALHCPRGWGEALKQVAVTGKINDPLISSERQDLAELDIPLFWYSPQHRRVLNSRGELTGLAVTRSGSEIATHRLSEKMNSMDLERQVWFMQLSLECHRRNLSLQNDASTPLATPTELPNQIERLIHWITDRIYSLVHPHGMAEPIVLSPDKNGDGIWMIRKLEPNERKYQLIFEVLDLAKETNPNLLKQRAKRIMDEVEYNLPRNHDLSLSNGLAGTTLQFLLESPHSLEAEKIMENYLESLQDSCYRFGLGFQTELVDVSHGWAGMLLPLLIYHRCY